MDRKEAEEIEKAFEVLDECKLSLEQGCNSDSLEDTITFTIGALLIGFIAGSAIASHR